MQDKGCSSFVRPVMNVFSIFFWFDQNKLIFETQPANLSQILLNFCLVSASCFL